MFLCESARSVCLPYQLCLYRDRSSVAQHFRQAGNSFGSVVLHRNNRVSTVLPCVLTHEVIGLSSGLFAKVRVSGNVATKEVFADRQGSCQQLNANER